MAALRFATSEISVSSPSFAQQSSVLPPEIRVRMQCAMACVKKPYAAHLVLSAEHVNEEQPLGCVLLECGNQLDLPAKAEVHRRLAVERRERFSLQRRLPRIGPCERDGVGGFGDGFGRVRRGGVPERTRIGG
ncbi:MAG: hypothetical protein RL385_1247 [Pseudomonadota bacterium]